jgi:serine/threonine-protein kinase
MGFVYLARHKVIDKKVAVKVLRNDLARDREILERFLQEAKAASSIGNAHIIDISDFGDLPDGSTYFVMEFLEGDSLAEMIDSGQQIPPDTIYHIAIQLADGLAAAHERGIVHRDLKPDNCTDAARQRPAFRQDPDFGIARCPATANKAHQGRARSGRPHVAGAGAGAPSITAPTLRLGVISDWRATGPVQRRQSRDPDAHQHEAPVIRALVLSAAPSLRRCPQVPVEEPARYQTMDDLAGPPARAGGSVPVAVGSDGPSQAGFSVPADYFKQPNLIVPATPPDQKVAGHSGRGRGRGGGHVAGVGSRRAPAGRRPPPIGSAPPAPGAQRPAEGDVFRRRPPPDGHRAPRLLPRASRRGRQDQLPRGSGRGRQSRLGRGRKDRSSR